MTNGAPDAAKPPARALMRRTQDETETMAEAIAARATRPPMKEIGYWAALFAILGPPIGAILPTLALMISSVVNLEAGWIGPVVVLIAALPAAYLFGLVPGLLTGAVGALIAERLADRRRCVLAVAGFGALAAAAWAAIVSGFRDLDPWALAWLALSGALAAAACAWLATAPKTRTPAPGAGAGAEAP